MKPRISNRFCSATLGATSLVASLCCSQAADQTWIDTNPIDDWNRTELNWDAGVPWVQGGNAVFGGIGETVYLTEPISVGNLTFGTGGYVITNDTLTLSAGGVIATGVNNATINSSLAGTAVIKTGAGTLTLGGNNTLNGGFTVRGGSLMLANAGALNSSDPYNALTLGQDGDSNPVLDVNGQSFNLASLTVGPNVTGAQVRTNAWGGPYVKGITTLNSPLTIVRYGNNTHEGFQTEGRITGNGGGSGNDSLTFERSGNNNFYWQTNNSVDANDFLGNVHVKNGELRHQATGAVNNTVIPDSAMLVIDSGASFRFNNSGTVTETIDGLAGAGMVWRNIPQYTLTINANNADNEGDRVFEGSLSGMTGTLTLGGTGTQEFKGASANFTNATALNNGTLKLTNATAWASPIAFGEANTPVVVLNAPATTDAWSFTKPITGSNASASVTKTGAGTVYITSPQAYAGTTVVNGGKLLLVSSSAAAPTDAALWLDASDAGTLTLDGTNVTAWANKGTSGGSFTSPVGNEPTLIPGGAAFNNQNVVDFDKAASDYLTNAANYTNTGTQLSAFVVLNRDAAAASYWGGVVSFGTGTGADWNQAAAQCFTDSASAGGLTVQRVNGYDMAISNGTTYVTDFVYSGSNVSGFVNGSQAVSQGSSGNFAINSVALGSRWNGTSTAGNYWDGKIAEVIVFNAALTNEQRQSIETYLGRKWVGSNYGKASLAGPVTVASSATFGGDGSAGPITVAGGGTLEGGNSGGTGMLTAGNLTLNGTVTLKGGITATAGYKAISAADFTVNGGPQSVLLAGLAGPGLTDGATYDFLTWSGTTNVTDGSVFKQVVRNLTPVLDLANKKVQVIYSAAGSSIYWTGGTSAWDGSANNWKLTMGNGVTQFMTSDAVLFHDLASGSNTIDISAADVSPASTAFDNTLAGTSYNLGGSKGIVSGSITKTNDGTVTITNSNPTAGEVTLNGGTISISQSGGLGSGNMTLDGGAKLQYTGTTATWTRNVIVNNTIGIGGATVEVGEAATKLSAGALAGAGSLTKAGAGALGFNGDGTYSGAISLSGGTLVANHANALGTGSATLVMGDAATGTNPVEFKVDSAIAAGVKLASITNSSFGAAQAIVLNTGSALAPNSAGLVTTLNLTGTVPVTLRATNTGAHGTAQDVNWRIEGAGIAAGTIALILDGTAAALRTSQLGDTTAASNFTGDVLIRGNVTTQGRTYFAGNNASDQNLNFASNDVTVDAGAEWKVVWGGETMGALHGSGQVTLNCQTALDNIGLTLGNTDRNGSFSGTITSGFGIRKKGGATQILSGTGSSYGGPTLIESGTLQMDGSKTGGGPVTVKPHATLSGVGIVNGTTTVEAFGIIAPGNSVTPISTLTLSNATLGGTYPCDLDDTTSDKLAVSGTLTLNADTKITFTGTPVADSYTLASYSILSGGLPSIAAPAGYAVAVDTSFNEIVLHKATAYDTWAASWTAPALADVSPDGDPDGDGITNVLEYVLGGDPRSSSTAILPKATIEGSDFVLSYKRSDASEAGTTQTGQWSADLETWSDLNATIELVNENGADPDDMRMRIPLSKAVDGKLFGRLGVSMP